MNLYTLLAFSHFYSTISVTDPAPIFDVEAICKQWEGANDPEEEEADE